MGEVYFSAIRLQSEAEIDFENLHPKCRNSKVKRKESETEIPSSTPIKSDDYMTTEEEEPTSLSQAMEQITETIGNNRELVIQPISKTDWDEGNNTNRKYQNRILRKRKDFYLSSPGENFRKNTKILDQRNNGCLHIHE